RIRDLATGVDLHGEAADTSGAGVWDGKDEGFFFVRVDTNHRPSKLFHRTIGGVERLIYEETDPGYFMGVGGSRLNDWIFLSIYDHETSEYRILPAGDPA